MDIIELEDVTADMVAGMMNNSMDVREYRTLRDELQHMFIAQSKTMGLTAKDAHARWHDVLVVAKELR